MTAPAPDDDATLVARTLGGDRRAYGLVMARHRLPLYRLIVAQTGDADDAADLLQETFVAAHGALHRFDPARSLRAWLSRIAINKCRDWRRRRYVRRLITGDFGSDDVARVPDDGQPLDAGVIERDRLARTMRAIDALPVKLREPLLLCAVEGLSQMEAAEALGTTAKTIETRVRRAREALRANLRDRN